MRKIPAESIDLVITSPPYNVGKEYEDNLTPDEYYNFILSVLKEILRILKPAGRVCWNVPYQMYPKSYDAPYSQHYFSMKAIMESGLKFRDNITWNQQVSDNETAWGSWNSPSSPWLRHQTEAIIIAYKGSWKLQKKGKSDLTAGEFMKYILDKWDMQSAKRAGHPAPFPIELPYRCIKLFSWVSAIVLDPFAGSGTTALACKLLNRNFIGIEVKPKYCKIARNRVYGLEKFFKDPPVG